MRCQCENGATCDPVEGHCNCTEGWMGQMCDQRKSCFVTLSSLPQLCFDMRMDAIINELF